MTSEINKYIVDNEEITNSKGLLIVDIDGLVKFFNNKFSSMFSLDNIDNINKLKFEPDLSGVIKRLAESDLSGFNNVFIYETDNKIINYKIEIEEIEIFDGRYYILLFSHDADQRFIEDKISNLHFALEYGNVPVMICDEKGTVTFANSIFEKILDSDLSNIYQQHISKILVKNLSSEKLEKLNVSLENGKKWSEIISISIIDEQPLYFELKLNPIYDESGIVINFVVTANDISYYVFKNQVTKRSENQLKSIINNISDLLIILKQSNEYIYFENGNDDFFKAFDLDKNDILLKKYEEALPDKLSYQIKQEIEKLKNNRAMKCEFDYKDNQKFYKSRIVIIEDDYSKDNLFVISLKDITDEEKKKEQLRELYKKEQQLNRLKTTFLQNMSHEIRTPFTAIMGYSDIMVECIEDKDYDTVLEITDSLKSVLNRVMNLFENILEVSEIETGDVSLELVSMNCNQILESVTNKKLPYAKSKNVEVELDLEEKSYLCEIDWIKFERVIMNLVDNAIKYTDKGKIKVSSKTTADYVTITISDTGLGINETIINRLLEPFVQEETDGHLRNYEGAGLGLTIAYEYTKLMNGEMNIKSSKNIGTEIFLNFPLQQI